MSFFLQINKYIRYYGMGLFLSLTLRKSFQECILINIYTILLKGNIFKSCQFLTKIMNIKTIIKNIQIISKIKIKLPVKRNISFLRMHPHHGLHPLPCRTRISSAKHILHFILVIKPCQFKFLLNLFCNTLY